MKKSLIRISAGLFAASFLFVFTVAAVYSQKPGPYVVMLSMDGFRWDYPDKAPTPNLHRLAQEGVKAVSLKPSFPTKTFPNHYAMATGLYPDHNGIVSNNFYDPVLKKRYGLWDRKAVTDPDFYNGEPIWVTAGNQGVLNAAYFWVGSETAVGGKRPGKWKEYNSKVPFGDRIDTVIAWLSLPEALRPHLILFYMEEPDSKGHDFGPDGKETLRQVVIMDSLVGVFLGKLAGLPIGEQVNVIITSDHGMENTYKEKTIFLDDYVKKEWLDEREGGSPVIMLGAKPGCLDSAFIALSKVSHIKVWKQGMVPARLHYGQNIRDLDLTVLADSCWAITWRGKKTYDGGNHGYDNDNTDMHAIFYAKGPAFKKGYTQPTFENVDLYGLICTIMGIKPAPNDGNPARVKGMLN